MFSCHNRGKSASKRGKYHDRNQTDKGRTAIVITVSHNYGSSTTNLKGLLKCSLSAICFYHFPLLYVHDFVPDGANEVRSKCQECMS